MTLRAITPKQQPTGDPEIPPLEPGDQLTRDEFERRYEVTPKIKAELIEGVVFFVSPVVRSGHFGSPRADLIVWLGRYRAFTRGVRVGCDSSVRLDLKNEIQPDAAMVIERAYGGQTRVSEDGFLEGAPELVGEVSASSVSIDMNSKLRVYRRNGVREYLVWRVKDRRIDWFALKQGQYEPLPEMDGIIRSEVFPGLWLKSEALINDDPTTALRVLQQGLDSPEHAAFVAQLKSRAAGPSTP
jgi:hypothetical protein